MSKCAPNDGWDGRGGSLWLDREQWGIVIDALIEHRASTGRRKTGNPDSTCDVRADECAELIGKINAAASLPPAPSARERDSEALLRDASRYLDPRHYPEIIARIYAHLGDGTAQ